MGKGFGFVEFEVTRLNSVRAHSLRVRTLSLIRSLVCV
jgi:hypothetical protein